MHDLDRDVALERRLDRLEDLAHAPLAELFQDEIGFPPWNRRKKVAGPCASGHQPYARALKRQSPPRPFPTTGEIFSPRRRESTFSLLMPGLLSELDLTRKIDDKSEYREKLHELQLNLLHFQRKILESQRNVILVFEGPDAAGKGGVIKRVAEKLDPRLIRVYSIVKPTEEEYRRHYLWRFWTKTPAQGELAIFDRSWYGRVLVERGGGLLLREGMEAGLRRDQRDGKDAGRRRLDHPQVLPPHQPRRAAAPVRENGRPIPTSTGRSVRKTGATARSGRSTSNRPRTCSPRPWTRQAPWHLVEASSSGSRGSRCSRRS